MVLQGFRNFIYPWRVGGFENAQKCGIRNLNLSAFLFNHSFIGTFPAFRLHCQNLSGKRQGYSPAERIRIHQFPSKRRRGQGMEQLSAVAVKLFQLLQLLCLLLYHIAYVQAIAGVSGYGYDHLILNVEWAKPSGN
jgi:hypothetical protein